MTPNMFRLLCSAGRLSDDDVRMVAARIALVDLMEHAAHLRDLGHGATVSYSRKVFIPLTRLCRDVCRYCIFAETPRPGRAAYLSPDQVLAIARAGQAAGCREALFTLGDKPERRYDTARDELAQYGHTSTVSYLKDMCQLVLRETTLLPHVNPGVLTRSQIADLRCVSVSQGLMLENISARLYERGGPHYASPDKHPRRRLATLRSGGRLRVPYTTGLLIGIGETKLERLESLLAIRALHEKYDHVQEVILQVFRGKQSTPMSAAPEAAVDELLWLVAMARLIFGPEMNLQAPPNLTPDACEQLIAAGLNDFGGISPVTPDHVNPEAPWPEVARLASVCERSGKTLVERLAVYPRYCRASGSWQDPALVGRVLKASDGEGFERTDSWSPGLVDAARQVEHGPARRTARDVERILADVLDGAPPDEFAATRLFRARGHDCVAVCRAADELRRRTVGDVVRYVVNRNINYTNVCLYHCKFCAFSKGATHSDQRGGLYHVDGAEVVRRVREAWARGATEVCMQGGIHPAYTGETYLNLCRTVKGAVPEIHIHAFSALEVWHGAKTRGTSLEAFLGELRAAGLGTLPGTAAEILDDEVRALICPDKLTTEQWVKVIETAHNVGIRTTATIMFGHIDRYEHWARHLILIRQLQLRTGGFTEFVPLPFVHMEAPLYLKGAARKGPTYREAVLMHAVARLVLHPALTNIQVSWVKMGSDAAAECLRAGANDLGGTLMNESISRAAGAAHGEEMSPRRMDRLIEGCGRVPEQRTTTYQSPNRKQVELSYRAAPLTPVEYAPLQRSAVPFTASRAPL